MNKKQAIAYAKIALHTLQKSANKNSITIYDLEMNMKCAFKLYNKKSAISKANDLK
ncbi:MAG: hypothetical protein Q4G09_02670 [Clostridia bacterium]|nr:hypothetical protein [Clostridia bacterium]